MISIAPVPSRSPALRFSWEPADPARLAAAWRTLEPDRRDLALGRSWDWIGPWLAGPAGSADLTALCVHEREELAAVGVFARGRTRLLGRRLLLHETGEPGSDALYVEYNGLAAPSDRSTELTLAALHWLVDDQRDWDELLLSGVTRRLADRLASFVDDQDVRIEERWASPVHAADLALVRTDGWEALPSLSGNARQQIRRSLRAFERMGEVRVEAPRDVEEALHFFDLLKRLHVAQWSTKGGGAFASAGFEPFHRALIAAGFDRERVQLLRVHAGETLLGVLYALVRGEVVHAYQSGFATFTGNELRPGLVAHLRAIEWNAARGFATYDFMAGAERLKQQLGSPVDELVWLRLRRRNWRDALERTLVGFIRQIRARQAKDRARAA